MKKNILFFIMLVISLCVNAQIQRNICGSKLAYSSKNDVVTYFKNKNIKTTWKDGALIVNQLKFAGQTWEEARFSFHKGKLYQVFFTSSSLTESKELLDGKWDYYSDLIKNKYSKYFISSMSADKDLLYYDDITLLKLVYSYYQGRWIFSIIYTDSNLLDDINASVDSEL